MNKIALITGGSRGLGRSMALRLAERGRDIVITYRSRAEEAGAVVKAVESAGGKAVALPLDVTRADTFDAFAASVVRVLRETWGREAFDFLVNNAGMGLRQEFADTTEGEFDLMVNAHLKGPFFLTQKLLSLLNDGGRIVNISSGLARFCQPGSAAYGAVKSGLETLSRYLALELGPRGIAVNALAPGPIESDFGGGTVRDDAELNRFLAANTALGRVGLPDDVGGAIAALLDDANGWMTGQRVEVSGGIRL